MEKYVGYCSNILPPFRWKYVKIVFECPSIPFSGWISCIYIYIYIYKIYVHTGLHISNIFLTSLFSWDHQHLKDPNIDLLEKKTESQKTHETITSILVGGWATPLKNDGLRQIRDEERNSQLIWENAKLMTTKPPTSYSSTNSWKSQQLQPLQLQDLLRYFNGKTRARWISSQKNPSSCPSSQLLPGHINHR